MERFWCYLVGFVVALVLMTMYIVVKNEAEKYKKKVEHRVRQIADVVLHEQFHNWTGCYLVDLDKFVDKRIDRKLAEKEGEHETPEL